MRFLREQLGQSLVELALTLPMLTFGLIGGADLARSLAIEVAVQNGARAGAEATALDQTPTSAEAVAHAQQEMNRTPGMNAANATITVTFTQADGTSVCTGAPNIQTSGASSIATPCYANVRVQYTFNTLVAWPIVPNTLSFDRSTRVRRFQ